MSVTESEIVTSNILETVLKAYRLTLTAKRMAELYDEKKDICSKYVHSTSRGHEAIQLAAAFHLRHYDYAATYYRDESILLGIGLEPHELMMQLMAKENDPFSGGRSYYNHPSLKREGFPTIPHQSSATGMQAIPATGMAHAIRFLEHQELIKEESPIVLCSLGDGSVTEGEVAESFQMAVLKKLPIIYLIQDNDWGISASGDEMRAMDAYEYAAGFKGLKRIRVNGSDFIESYEKLDKVYKAVRDRKGPYLVHATCPLLGHHTSGVRKEWYRGEEDLGAHSQRDPLIYFEEYLDQNGVSKRDRNKIAKEVDKYVNAEFEKAFNSPDADPSNYDTHEFAPATLNEELGSRKPKGSEKVVMVDAALHAIDEILANNPDALFYGQDVGRRLGGVFREAATLAEKYGDERVFNTPIQEAYIVGSTAGMSAVGAKAIVEIQFADYIWPGMNQLVEELSKSCYLSKGQFPVQSLIRVPIGAYGGGGPYHSGSIESTLLTIRGIKVVYPSNAADMKGLLKAAFHDPNPVVMLEHKGLYWSKVKGTDYAKNHEPDADYILPLGKGNIVQESSDEVAKRGETMTIITYGMGVHWSLNATKKQKDIVEIVDLRTLNPIDWDLIRQSVEKNSRVLVLTEEPRLNSFAESIAGRISEQLFESLDAPVKVLGASNLPAVPLNTELEKMMLPNQEKVADAIKEILAY